jgi:hypothetical protein
MTCPKNNISLLFLQAQLTPTPAKPWQYESAKPPGK